MCLMNFLWFFRICETDDHFIIKELPKEFGRQFKCLGENTEKYKTFSVPIEKEVDNSTKMIMKVL